jgi:hypothetical protein
MLLNLLMPLTALPLTGSLLVAAADRAPSLNVTPSCRAAATMGGEGGRTIDSCLKSEQNAREQIDREWTHFSPIDRSQCVQTTTGGFEPTYTELLTCLEMARDSRTRKQEQAGAKPKL